MSRKVGTLVICTAGVSRSAMVCIAYLMKYEKMSMKKAHKLVKQARKHIKPNPGFMNFLKKYERHLNIDPNCELCKLEKKT